eukprot:CAMPEP_0172716088 /NCGR_PEP_ID=MMETSP1074-20121228/67922_1 /TAXON_ID=2916 /ORGANISM="Ceratium fusus, Strain PA161109" /LENGTH=175 /DNA_ID=CAMNT_0013540739 /DNA_START=68 /DNA_END=598 /DNA_ORIENTATION=+
MTLRQYVRRAGMPPASLSNFESLAIDSAAFPQKRQRNERKLTGAPQRSCPCSEHSKEELSLASMVLFDALALEAASCPQVRRGRATHQAVKLMVFQRASKLKQSNEVEIPLSHTVSSFLPSSACVKGSGSDPACCGNSDGTGDHDVGHMHTISDLASSTSTETDGSHDFGIEADL